MTTQTSVDTHIKPRLLIADDSRIVRATLIKHIEGRFEFREALDGEQAWEVLLIDPTIRVVITDLTMPRLDGYGLLQKIRSSKISRIRNLPVVVVSGSDELEERERARAAGATDLITKGIDTAQLLSRLDILSRLTTARREFEEPERDTILVKSSLLTSSEALQNEAASLLANAIKNNKNFAILNIRVGFRHASLEGDITALPASVTEEIGQLLQRTVRQTDQVAATGKGEFMLVTGGIGFNAAHSFARRVCRTIMNANLTRDEQTVLVASCGLSSLGEDGGDAVAINFHTLEENARCRARLAFSRGIIGVVGSQEERAILNGQNDVGALGPAAPEGDEIPDLTTILQWMKEGKREQVQIHIGAFATELQPLMELVLQQARRP